MESDNTDDNITENTEKVEEEIAPLNTNRNNGLGRLYDVHIAVHLFF